MGDRLPQESMVLRTVYLPLEMDRRLGELAYTRGVSKGELLREFVARGLEGIAASGECSLAERLAERAAGSSPP